LFNILFFISERAWIKEAINHITENDLFIKDDS